MEGWECSVVYESGLRKLVECRVRLGWRVWNRELDMVSMGFEACFEWKLVLVGWRGIASTTTYLQRLATHWESEFSCFVTKFNHVLANDVGARKFQANAFIGCYKSTYTFRSYLVALPVGTLNNTAGLPCRKGRSTRK